MNTLRMVFATLAFGTAALSLTACTPKDNAQVERDVQEGVNKLQEGARQLGDSIEKGAENLRDNAEAVGDGIEKGLQDDK